jgi:hypothetical protein
MAPGTEIAGASPASRECTATIIRVGTDAALGRRSAARHDLGDRIGCALPSRAQCAAVLFENIPVIEAVKIKPEIVIHITEIIFLND